MEHDMEEISMEESQIEDSFEEVKERYELAMERIGLIPNEDNVKEPYADYFKSVATFLLTISEYMMEENDKGKDNLTLSWLQKRNQELYADILPGHYDTSYANPEYAAQKMGSKYGKQLTFLYSELRGLIVYATEKRWYHLTIYLELFIEIYNYFEEEDTDTYLAVKSALYYFYHDYCDDLMDYRTREQLDSSLSFSNDIICREDLDDPSYLYLYGEYISENELLTQAYLKSLPQTEIEAMASTYTEGFRMGFVNNNIDLSKKSIVNIRFAIGFERIVKAAIRQFEQLGLVTVTYRTSVCSLTKKQHIKVGYFSTGPNKQYDYDHRLDDGLYLDRAFITQKLVSLRKAHEKYKKLANQYAGPAVIEIFGEKPFEPINKESCIHLNHKQQQLAVEYQREASLIINEYIKSEEYSFTIIAYPVPEIGPDYEDIFDETVKVNTLDINKYQVIQQMLIDTLDQGEYVRIKGSGHNKTDLQVMLHKLENPDKETNFENCLADVNIPVGEVFTSPVLTGTCGILHVTEVYLNELKYKELDLRFEDGKIATYTCKNFDKEEENIAFVKENLMYHRETLPIGEFAIGTNTTAYVMGKRFGISHVLPILIAEKTGPHFAVGDTCYKMSEENKVFNPDGKEIVAKDNECSILRKSEIEKAYFNCHTDITIPYDELEEIAVYTLSGKKIEIIKNGRFVLEGTQYLNEPFA